MRIFSLRKCYKNIISNIYYFYKLENILDNFDIFIYQNNIAIKELIPRYVKRLTDNQMKNRLYALYIWDRIEFHNDKFSTCIKQFESITENRNVYDTIKHQFENTKKSRAFPN